LFFLPCKSQKPKAAKAAALKAEAKAVPHLHMASAVVAAAQRQTAKGPPKKEIGDPRGGWVGQSTKKD
jgi:hypothetical protein